MPLLTSLKFDLPSSWELTSNNGLHLEELALPSSITQRHSTGLTLWQPADPLPVSSLEAAAVQQQGAHVQVACCAGSGGPGNVWAVAYGQLQGATEHASSISATAATAAAASSSSSAAASQSCQQGPASPAEVLEVEELLRQLQSSGVKRSRVLRVVRVQNPILWRRYCLRRQEMRDELGPAAAAGINEQQLFHGTSAAAAAAITKDGFDCRLNSAGVYGQGTYFSDCSYTAVVYSNIKGAATVGTLTLLAARVLLGRQCEGKYGMRRPPEGFDSVTSRRTAAVQKADTS
ncbi:hypothetical protein OEZ85_013877 [Tetradesmus obliquus]|uniref:Poly [ADP-ribose] polymerase n=1 Tax=Tetradesmus obliquus TaxID=3088 RepID=A0ABY8U6G2_TETOB|nr:hypothetical protein OEZ85_013877 [Tetradesmus obliquus]